MRLYVKYSQPSINILVFIRDNFQNLGHILNNLQIIKISDGKISPDTRAELGHFGITRLPALLTEDSLFIGEIEIRKYLNSGKKAQRRGNTTLEDWMQNNIYSGVKMKNKVMNVEDDGDDSIDETTDFKKQLGDYMKNISEIKKPSSESPESPREDIEQNLRDRLLHDYNNGDD